MFWRLHWGQTFKTYVQQQVLLPELAKDDTVLLTSRHAKLKFLPRYSPDILGADVKAKLPESEEPVKENLTNKAKANKKIIYS